MWQELAGAKKDTPARFSFPILFRGDFNACVLRSFGQFRWELCKNIEGPHWSDYPYPSMHCGHRLREDCQSAQADP